MSGYNKRTILYLCDIVGLVNVCAVVLMVLFFAANPFKRMTEHYATNLITASTMSSGDATAMADATDPSVGGGD